MALSGGYDDDVDLGYALFVFPPLLRPFSIDLHLLSTYTGSGIMITSLLTPLLSHRPSHLGGRDLKGTKNAPKNVSPRLYKKDSRLILFQLRTAPQSSDQSFENNASHL